MNSWAITYLALAMFQAGYLLGLMHAKGHTHWLNTVVSLLFGLVWPVPFFWGVYLIHFKRSSPGENHEH